MHVIIAMLIAFFQVILFSAVPFIWWLITARKKASFGEWTGFKLPVIAGKVKYILLFIGTVCVFSALSVYMMPQIIGTASPATSQFAHQGASSIVPALIYAFIQTGLSEEILFRGFIGKRLDNKFGFAVGNLLQAVLFGLLHGAMFLGAVGIGKAAVIALFTGAIGWVMGYIDEKQSGGSILSSWMLHGIANFISASVAMFNII